MACQAGEFSFCVLSRFISLAMRGSVAKTPYFPKTISCLEVRIGETGRSGRNPGWDGLGKKRTIPNEFREGLQGLPKFGIRV
jgi:hypothetical protein